MISPRDGTHGQSAPGVTSTAIGNIAREGSVQINGPVTSIINSDPSKEPTVEERSLKCLAALLVTNPECDHRSILTSKGNLVVGTCRWIEDVTEFQSWLTGTSHLLWISGGPGKGKTFLSIHLVDTLPGLTKKRATDNEEPLVLRYFCDNSDNHRNTALTVVRGLLYQILVADQTPYDDILRPFELRQAKGENLFTDAHIEELWSIFEKMVAKVRRPVYLLLDGLDECDRKSVNFLTTKLEKISTSCTGDTKWSIKTVVVSRPNTKVPTDLRIDLDQEHSQSTEQDVTIFVQGRVKDIRGIGEQQPELERVLLDRAGGTFLWVWLATSMLKDHPEQAQEILHSQASANLWLPKGLDAMYERMLLGIRERDAEAAAAVLCRIAMASRPLTRSELRHICAGTKGINTDLQIEVSCRNLLTVTGHTVQLVHLSLKEYLVRIPRRNLSASVARFFGPSLLLVLKPLLRFNKLYLACRVSSALLLSLVGLLLMRRYARRFSNVGVAVGSFCYMLLPTRRTMVVCAFGIDERKAHGELFLKCLEIMEVKLKKNGCNLDPGTLAAKVDNDKISHYLPSHVQYACVSWVYHLGESQARARDGDRVHQFLESHFLHWLEALSLIGRASESIGLVRTLEGLLRPSASTDIASFLADASRFVQANVAIIAKAPFQIYTSALAFAPKNSILKRTFLNEIPPWLSVLPNVKSDWGTCLKTLEGHEDSVESVAFSHDAKLVVSGSRDRTIKVWDAATGAEVRTLKRHDDSVKAVAFSHDAKLVVSGSEDCTVKIWDAAAGTELMTLQVGTTINNLSFHLTVAYLRTNVGLIGTLDLIRLLEPGDKAGSFSGRTVGRGYGISSSGAWITWHGNEVFWLPAEYRSVRSVVAAEEVTSGVATGITARVALGCLSGRVIILGFLGAPAP